MLQKEAEMAKSKQKKVLTALSLQGGGALGAYEYGMLKALYVKRGKTFRPRVVTGVSIGAINAAFLVGAKGDPIEALDTLWRERLCVTWPAPSCTMPEAMSPAHPWMPFMDLTAQNLSVFGNPGMYSLKPEFYMLPWIAPMRNTSIYDTAALKKTLEEFVDPRKLNRPDITRIIVTAVNVETGGQARFDNAKATLTFDHIIASGSFPVTFPMTRIGEEYYWDGGIFFNMPVGAAVNALEQIETDNPDVEREIILVELHRMQSRLPKTLQEATERFFNLIFSGKFAMDMKLKDKYDAFVDLMHEIDKTLPAGSPIRNHPGYRDLIRHRKMDRVIVVGEGGIGAVGSTGDFSRKTLNQRIDAGFSDAMSLLG